MPQFGFIISSPICLLYGCFTVVCIGLFINGAHGATVNQVSIEDFIDLDEGPSNTPVKHTSRPLSDDPNTLHTFTITHDDTGTNNNNDVNIRIDENDDNNKINNQEEREGEGEGGGESSVRKGVGYISIVDPTNDVIFDDDEDFLSSGSGSGSGDFLLDIGDVQDGAGLVLTDIPKKRGVTKDIKVAVEALESSQKIGDDENRKDDLDWNGSSDDMDNEVITDDDDDDDDDGDDEGEDEEGEYEEGYEAFYDNEDAKSDDVISRIGEDDSIYDLINVQSDGTEKEKQWSKWRRVGSTFKVRVEQCNVEGQGSESGHGCEKDGGGGGIRLQVKSCTKTDGCGEIRETSTDLKTSCDGVCQTKNESTPRPFSLSPNPSPTPSPTPTTPPTPHGCQYSLYDTKRRKYVFVRWDLSQVVTQSKVKRWCKKDNDQYMIMSTPTDVCKNYLHELCQASQKCKSNKPPRERGDFAEGCWRGLVFGDMLPIGLSNKQTIIYFICQRYSSDSAMGRVFGYKDTHFGTLYDSKLRAPVLSLHKMLQVGDETWPESDYFIEHGLIEQKKDVMWLFSRHRKGMVTLKDLDRCYRDQTCDLGRFQVLPQDYSRESGNSAYWPVPLVWPEWMNTDPETRTSTLALTNTVPLHSSLHEEWTSAVKKVRAYAIEECGIPYVSDPTHSQLGQLSSHRSNKSALYLTSGAIPTRDPAIKTGREVPVPSHLWIAGCCVRKLMRGEDMRQNDVLIDGDEETTHTETKITSFTLHIKNEPGNLVNAASISRLEMLLQDFYKVKDREPDVSLFPGQENACSDLRNDVSEWFQSDK